MAENEHDADRELAREHVLEAQPGHLRVTLKDVLAASNSVKGMIESITTEFSKRIREKANEVSDSDEQEDRQ
jgi:hypothetical protein